jgi:hypothetical protein
MMLSALEGPLEEEPMPHPKLNDLMRVPFGVVGPDEEPLFDDCNWALRGTILGLPILRGSRVGLPILRGSRAEVSSQLASDQEGNGVWEIM